MMYTDKSKQLTSSSLDHAPTDWFEGICDDENVEHKTELGYLFGYSGYSAFLFHLCLLIPRPSSGQERTSFIV